MQSLVAVLLGLCSLMVAMPVGCSGPEWGAPSSGPSSASGPGSGGAAGAGGSGAGGPIDGYKECTEYCEKLYGEQCLNEITPDECIVIWCVNVQKDVGPSCQDEFDSYMACVNAWVHTFPPGTMQCALAAPECQWPLYANLANCRDDYGCDALFRACDDMWPAPNGGTGCHCRSHCKHRLLVDLCWMEGATQVCECEIDDVLVGTCEQAPAKICAYPKPYESCCNQYFMLW
jgi:hypothetical protein